MSNDAYRVAYEFVKEQSCGEWTDEQIAADATALSAVLRAYAADVAAQASNLTPQMVCVVPVGWQLVPREASLRMLDAGAEQNIDQGREQLIFEAMLEKAPKPPLPVATAPAETEKPETGEDGR